MWPGWEDYEKAASIRDEISQLTSKEVVDEQSLASEVLEEAPTTQQPTSVKTYSGKIEIRSICNI
ncbi:MAG: hypothetical protein EBW15_11065 [Actinobacteria bacterium]|nr:hypothetical protein [Actinomycetota bacterium]